MLDIVLDASQSAWLGLAPGTAGRLDGRVLRMGALHVTLDEAVSWNPAPDWPAVRDGYALWRRHFPQLVELSFPRAHTASLLARVFNPWSSTPSLASELPLTAIRNATDALVAGLHGDEGQLRAGAHELAGLGPGLTPAGDDWLLGVMLWVWSAHPQPEAVCQTLLGEAQSRTTALSAAFLKAAAAGQFDERWHVLLDSLRNFEGKRLCAAVRHVLALGSTPGADALAGFLSTGLAAEVCASGDPALVGRRLGTSGGQPCSAM